MRHSVTCEVLLHHTHVKWWRGPHLFDQEEDTRNSRAVSVATHCEGGCGLQPLPPRTVVKLCVHGAQHCARPAGGAHSLLLLPCAGRALGRSALQPALHTPLGRCPAPPCSRQRARPLLGPCLPPALEQLLQTILTETVFYCFCFFM